MKWIVALFFLSSIAHAYEWNIRTAPLTLVVGANLRVDHRLTENFSLGVSGLYIDRQIKAVNILESAGAFTLQYAFTEALATGWFIEGTLGYGDIKASALSTANQIESKHLFNMRTRVIGGYNWYWENFNIAIGGGLEHNSAGDHEIESPSGTSVNRIPLRKNLFVPEASVGWAW